MDPSNHVPSLTHLREFARSRATGRSTHVRQDRAQVIAPANDRVFAFVYEKFLSGVIEFVDSGSRGNALGRVVTSASPRMRSSYEAAAKGMSTLLPELRPASAKRRQRNVVVLDELGTSLVSLRIHLLFDLPDGRRFGALMYFSEAALTETELSLMETAVTLALRQVDPVAIPAIIMVRAGVMRPIDAEAASRPERVQFLRRESEAYRAEWVATV